MSMKVQGERGRSALYIGYVYMLIDSTSAAVVESCHGRLKEDVLRKATGDALHCLSW